MIIGMGSDIIDIRRIELALRRFGTRFENRVFTEGERRLARGRKKASERIMAATYAKRFAAKEACAKALGTGLRAGTFWRDMEVVNLPTGRPTMKLSGGALKRLQTITPAHMKIAIHVSLSDDYPLASAQVIIEAHE